MRRLFIVLFVLLGPVGAVPAADPPPLVKDLRARGSTSALAVVLAARPGVPGHAMVILGKEDAKKMVSSQEAFGFYPAEGKKAALGRVPGKVVDEILEGKGTAGVTTRVIVKVDQDLYDKVEAVRKKWLTKGYKVLEADCVTFTGEVAAALGLKVPERTDAKLPVTFIEKLAELNK